VGRLADLLHAQRNSATRNATVQQPVLHVASPSARNTQQGCNGVAQPDQATQQAEPVYVSSNQAVSRRLTDLLHLASPRVSNAQQQAYRWRIVLPDGHAFPVGYTPEATRAEVEEDYPGASVEADERRPSPVSNLKAVELRCLISLVYVNDSEPERQEALDAALADPESALACYRDISSRSAK
jgi:hypothetical protein